MFSEINSTIKELEERKRYLLTKRREAKVFLS